MLVVFYNFFLIQGKIRPKSNRKLGRRYKPFHNKNIIKMAPKLMKKMLISLIIRQSKFKPS